MSQHTSSPHPVHDVSTSGQRLDDALAAHVDAICPNPWIRLEGELDVVNHEQLTNLVAGFRARGHRHVTVDLSAVTVCDAKGLSAIVEADRALRADGGALVLTGVSTLLARVLETTGVDHLQLDGPARPAPH